MHALKKRSKLIVVVSVMPAASPWQGYHSQNSGAKLEKRKVYARYVPNKLNVKQKQEQTASC